MGTKGFKVQRSSTCFVGSKALPCNGEKDRPLIFSFDAYIACYVAGGRK